jgi:hypothetical protein
MIGHTVASLAKAGLDRIIKTPVVGQTPGMGEFWGLARDASNVVDIASLGAARVRDVAEAVGNSQRLRKLGRNFEKQGKLK